MLTPSDAHCGDKIPDFSNLSPLIVLEHPFNALKVATESKFTNLKPHTAFLFPGQGAQTVGMGKVRSLVFPSAPICADMYSRIAMLSCLVVQHAMPMVLQDVVEEVSAAKDLFAQASDILGYDLLKVCTEGEPCMLLSHCTFSSP